LAASPHPRRQRQSAHGRSPILPRNVTTSRQDLEQRLLAALDAVDEPISIGAAIRDRDGRILDFRIEYVNPAAARWAGVPRDAIIGLITGELLPEFRASGHFDGLVKVVETGVPHFEEGAVAADRFEGGRWIGGTYDLRAIRLGDGYLSTWRQSSSSPEPG
jgi:PAS domain-containing protein